MDTGHKWHFTGKCIRTPAIFNLHKRLKTWSDRWLLKFHPSKCYYITIGQHNEEEFTYSMIEYDKKFDMTKVSVLKDIGVIVDSELKLDKHINSK